MDAKEKISWSTQSRNISELIPAEYNPRQITPKQATELKASLDKFSLADPLVINADNKIIGGHQRYHILKASGQIVVDVRVPDRKLDIQEERELNVRLNKNSGEFDFDLLSNFDETLLKEIGFDSIDLDKIFQVETKPEDDHVPDNVSPIVQRGEIYQLGQHRLMCGDSTDQADVFILMDNKKASVGITDPPYGVRKQEEWDKKDLFLESLDAWFSNYKINSEKGLIWFCAGKMLPFLVIREGFERLLVWNKPAGSQFAGASNNNLWYSNEPILVFDYGELKKNCGTTIYSYSVFESRTIAKSITGHPTSKPVDLMVWLVEHFSCENNIVMDLFLGSGSTLIACEKTSRTCYGMEIDPHYCDVIIKRWEDFTGQKAQKVN